jgi:hypothetical protein
MLVSVLIKKKKRTLIKMLVVDINIENISRNVSMKKEKLIE